MFYVLYGPDQFRAREKLRAIRSELDRDGNISHNTARLEGKTLTPAELRAACHTASFFAEDRLVIVEGLLSRLGTAGHRGRRGRAGGAPSGLDEFVEVLTSLPETTTVVLLDEQAPAGFLEAIGSKASIHHFPVLRGVDLRAWAAARAKSQGAAFAPPALDRLVALIDGHHLGELASEIDKLATYAAGRQIAVEDVDELASAAVQYQFWDLTDAVIEGRADRALGVLQRMDARDQPPQLLSFMLVRQYRHLVLAQAMLQEGLGAAQIGAYLGLHDFPLRKVIEQASRYPAARLEQAYRKLLASDVAVKTGVLDADAALEMLIVELAELARTPSRRAAPA